uniref:Reverse transcriptase RNase H-like domain-containing protein n=1 Tax=Amphimedon queenslandica TaxID=400682 RepID=A0A1X7TLX8_AMPQE
MDNTTAIAFLNKKGVTHSKTLSDLEVSIWFWCLQRNLTVYAEHIPGSHNCLADSLSRRKLESSDWRLDQIVFRKLQRKCGPFDIDLFAARHNSQLKSFFSYHQDPEALASDALAQSWEGLSCYAFPPFLLLGRVLQKISRKRLRKVVIIAPNWPSQIWYPVLVSLLMDYPLILPEEHSLLRNLLEEFHTLVLDGSLSLTTWRVSGLEEDTRTFQLKHLTSYAQPGGRALRSPMQLPGGNGALGVNQIIPIQFQHL